MLLHVLICARSSLCARACGRRLDDVTAILSAHVDVHERPAGEAAAGPDMTMGEGTGCDRRVQWAVVSLCGANGVLLHTLVCVYCAQRSAESLAAGVPPAAEAAAAAGGGPAHARAGDSSGSPAAKRARLDPGDAHSVMSGGDESEGVGDAEVRGRSLGSTAKRHH